MTSSEEFRQFGSAMIAFVANYVDGLRDRPVLPQVEPGYLMPMLPREAPFEAESWKAVMADIDRVIMPGVTHWHSPHFHAYFPTANSYPAIVADILSDAIACIGFSWIASPACTELEMAMLNWLGRMLQLPENFLFDMNSNGGGVIQGTASEATLVALLTARSRITGRQASVLPQKLVAYASKLAHSSVERAAMLGGVQIRLLETDGDMKLRGDTLARAIEEDKAKGLVPFLVVATLGTTSCCSFDNLPELGVVCRQAEIWLHVDAAYAGSAFICPEYRPLLNGVEQADSFNFNPHKWLLVNFDCSAMWVRDANEIESAFRVDPLYLRHAYQDNAVHVPDYRHWHVPLGRRFRSLKLWFVMRLYGQHGLRTHIRKQIGLAHEFEDLVRADGRFKVVLPVTMGLVVFRLVGDNAINEELNKRINAEGKIHLTPSTIGDLYILRFAVCSRLTQSSDVEFAFLVISRHASGVLSEQELSTDRVTTV